MEKLTNEWYCIYYDIDDKCYAIVNIDYEQKIVTLKERYKKQVREYTTQKNIQFVVDTNIDDKTICFSNKVSRKPIPEKLAKISFEEDMKFVDSLPSFNHSLEEIYIKMRSVDNGQWKEFNVKQSDKKYYTNAES